MKIKVRNSAKLRIAVSSTNEVRSDGETKWPRIELNSSNSSSIGCSDKLQCLENY